MCFYLLFCRFYLILTEGKNQFFGKTDIFASKSFRKADIFSSKNIGKTDFYR